MDFDQAPARTRKIFLRLLSAPDRNTSPAAPDASEVPKVPDVLNVSIHFNWIKASGIKAYLQHLSRQVKISRVKGWEEKYYNYNEIL